MGDDLSVMLFALVMRWTRLTSWGRGEDVDGWTWCGSGVLEGRVLTGSGDYTLTTARPTAARERASYPTAADTATSASLSSLPTSSGL